MQKMWSINAKTRGQVTASKNGTHHGKKGSAHPKMEEFSTRRSWHIQKQGRKGQNGVHASKNRRPEGVGTYKNEAVEARQGQHMQKRDNMEPEGVSTSKKGMIWGQKGFMHPKEGHMMA